MPLKLWSLKKKAPWVNKTGEEHHVLGNGGSEEVMTEEGRKRTVPGEWGHQAKEGAKRLYIRVK